MTTARRVAVLLCVGFGLTPAVGADANPVAQRDQQKRVMAEAEQTARRITTTLRVLSYQNVGGGTEEKVLAEVATALRGLSDDQIKAVLAHLDAAVKAPDETTASGEQKKAYQKHRQVVTSLKGLLAKLDVVKSLDAAAGRIDKIAQEEHRLHLRALQGEVARQFQRSRRTADDREEQADAQRDQRNELQTVKDQLFVLVATLSAEQRDRVQRADAFGKAGRLEVDMEQTAQALNNGGFKDAAAQQLKTAKDLQALAAALRTPRDKMTALKEARDKIEKALQAELALKAETEKKPKADDAARDRRQQDPARVQGQQLADRQAKIEFDTRQVRKELEDVAKDAAAKLTPAESEMKRAEDELRNTDLGRAVEPEQNAAKRLAEARDELDKQIAAAEREKADALAATKKAAEMVDQLLKEQKQVREATKQDRDPEAMKKQAEKEKEIARKAVEVRNLPLPENTEAKTALDDATAAAKQAAEALARPDADAAKPKQDDAVTALEAAKKALDDKAKEIEKRRDDMAKLDDAAKKLDALARDEKKLAADAETKDAKSDELAKQQGELTPQAKEVADAVKDAAPDAKTALDKAGEKMAAAEKKLNDGQKKPAAVDAKNAAKELDAAKAALAKKADELKAKEAADQAALQPNQVNPADAAQQLAKAVEQAKQAAAEAKKAEQAGEPSLAEMQKKIAAQAEKANQPDAAKAAAEAAEALEKGDLPGALEQQQKAMDKLETAGEPKPAETGVPTPGQLAGQQKKVKDATAALAKSAEANKAAQAALNQAQSLAPQTVQPQLKAAAGRLQEAGKQLGDGKPGEAGQNQTKAADQLTQALGTLNAAAEAMGQKGAQPGQPQEAQPKPGQQPGQEPGQQPGPKPGEKGKQPGQKGQPGKQPGEKDEPGEKGDKGDGQEKNDATGEGNREGGPKPKNAAADGKEQAGDGSFINLRKRERDKVQQAAEAAFPAEFRELIKQYNINIKSAGKAQATPPKK